MCWFCSDGKYFVFQIGAKLVKPIEMEVIHARMPLLMAVMPVCLHVGIFYSVQAVLNACVIRVCVRVVSMPVQISK